MTASEAVSQVQAAVQALYSGTPEQQSQANAWLNSWAGSDEAWQVAIGTVQHQAAALEVGWQ